MLSKQVLANSAAKKQNTTRVTIDINNKSTSGFPTLHIPTSLTPGNPETRPIFSPSEVTLANVAAGEEEVVNKAGGANTSMHCLAHKSRRRETPGGVAGAARRSTRQQKKFSDITTPIQVEDYGGRTD